MLLRPDADKLVDRYSERKDRDEPVNNATQIRASI